MEKIVSSNVQLVKFCLFIASGGILELYLFHLHCMRDSSFDQGNNWRSFGSSDSCPFPKISPPFCPHSKATLMTMQLGILSKMLMQKRK